MAVAPARLNPGTVRTQESSQEWRWPRRLTSAPASTDTVAAFRPWRGFRSSVARGRRGHHRRCVRDAGVMIQSSSGHPKSGFVRHIHFPSPFGPPSHRTPVTLPGCRARGGHQSHVRSLRRVSALHGSKRDHETVEDSRAGSIPSHHALPARNAKKHTHQVRRAILADETGEGNGP